MTRDIDLKILPFDTEEMLKDLRPWIETESPSYDPAAVNRMMDLAMREFAAAGASVERIPGSQGLGDNVRVRWPHAASGSPGILVLCHLDTVHPVGTLGAFPWRIEGDRCYGPGLFDMKGGSFLAFHAMRVLQRERVPTSLPVTFLLTSDEEIGSPSTRDLIEREAARHKFVFVPEPARRDGGVVTGRYAIARCRLTATGRPSPVAAGPVPAPHFQRWRCPRRAMGQLRRYDRHDRNPQHVKDGCPPRGLVAEAFRFKAVASGCPARFRKKFATTGLVDFRTGPTALRSSERHGRGARICHPQPIFSRRFRWKLHRCIGDHNARRVGTTWRGSPYAQRAHRHFQPRRARTPAGWASGAGPLRSRDMASRHAC